MDSKHQAARSYKYSMNYSNKGETFAFCKVCIVDFSVADEGVHQIIRHCLTQISMLRDQIIRHCLTQISMLTDQIIRHCLTQISMLTDQIIRHCLTQISMLTDQIIRHCLTQISMLRDQGTVHTTAGGQNVLICGVRDPQCIMII